jgi:tRNA isopentenyl-2-thiomethyl-A-37 hydroxylase MiaE
VFLLFVDHVTSHFKAAEVLLQYILEILLQHILADLTSGFVSRERAAYFPTHVIASLVPIVRHENAHYLQRTNKWTQARGCSNVFSHFSPDGWVKLNIHEYPIYPNSVVQVERTATSEVGWCWRALEAGGIKG